MYVIGHDIGTSGVKSVLLAESGAIVASRLEPLSVLHRGPLLAEQRPQDWLDAIAKNSRALVDAAGDPSRIDAVSFAAQMQGTVLVAADGQPLHDALIWLDMRAAAESKEAVAGWPRVQGYGLFRLWRWLRLSNGVPGLSGRDPVAKMLWLKRHAPALWQRAHKALDVKDFILAALTGRFVTSHDCANTTWLMDTRQDRMCWSDELCARLEIESEKLPEIAASSAEAGGLLPEMARAHGLLAGTRVFVGAGDLAAMALGVGATERGQTAIALGTSAWVSSHVKARVHDLGTYTASICSALPDTHLVVAHQESGGACLQWLCAQLDRDPHALLAAAAPDAAGLVFLPWMNGEYAPIDDPFVRGGFANLSLQHTKAHMIRAVLEGVAYNVRWALSAVDALAPSEGALRIGGGGAQSPLWCQILADVTGREIIQVEAPELACARGAARVAHLGLGVSSTPVAARATFQPQSGDHARGFERLRRFYKDTRGWHRALARS